MIVKVQLSIATSAGKQQVLIYNKSRTLMYEAEASDEMKKLMYPKIKKYFEARHSRQGPIELLEEAPEQDW